jgi:hypothetical protein
MGNLLFLAFFILNIINFKVGFPKVVSMFFNSKKKEGFTNTVFLDCDTKCNLYCKVHLSLSI